MTESERRRPVLVFPAAHQRGGVERIVWESLTHLAALGPVAFVGSEFDPPLNGVEFIRVPAPRRNAFAPWVFRRRAAHALKQATGPRDAVVSFGSNCPPGHVGVVNSVHRTWLRHGAAASVRGVRLPGFARYLAPKHHVLLRLERTYYGRNQRMSVVAVSQAIADDLHALEGVDSARITVIPNGYSPSLFSPSLRRERRSAQRELWNVREESIVLLFVANELHRKGFACLIEAVSRLGDERLEVHVVGRTPLTAYHRRISELGLTDRVVYHGSMETGLAHAAADVLVLPTQYEAFALTIVEGLASGLPVITTSVPGAGDLIEHDHNGLLQHDPLDAGELASLLERALDPITRRRLGEQAARSVEGLDWASLAGRLDAVVQASP